jgi:hypothetical protein
VATITLGAGHGGNLRCLRQRLTTTYLDILAILQHYMLRLAPVRIRYRAAQLPGLTIGYACQNNSIDYWPNSQLIALRQE